MTFSLPIPDPIRPYLALIKLGLVAAVLVAVFVKGCQHGVASGAEAHATAITDLTEAKNRVIERKNAALRAAEASLRAGAQVLRDVDAETRRAEAAQNAAEARARSAEAVAARANAELAKRIDGFGKVLEHARRNPDCNALLNMDLEAACGL